MRYFLSWDVGIWDVVPIIQMFSTFVLSAYLFLLTAIDWD